jgi:hypothetical protein
MPNVFISHRSSDNASAEKLAIEIRAAGHSVWLDIWEIEIGDRIVARISEGLQGASYLVLCYSASGMSDWTDIEWTSFLARQLEGKGVKILPARLSGGVAPAILEGTKYADLISDWDKGVRALLQAIK